MPAASADDDRQADAVHRQAVARRQLRRRAPSSAAAGSRRRRLDLGDLADRFNEAGEHIPRSARRGRAARARSRRASAATRAAAAATRRPPVPSDVRRHDTAGRDRPARVPDRACSVAPPSSSSDADRRARPAARARRAQRAASPRDSQRSRAPALERSSRRVGRRRRGCRRRHDYDRPGVERREQARRGRRPQPAVEDDARQRPLPIRAARRQQRIVGEHRAGPDADGVDLGPLAVDRAGWPPARSAASARPAARAMQPSRLSADLQGHERPALAHHA